MKILLRDPIGLDHLKEKLRIIGFRISPKREEWLRQHSDHSGLVLEPQRLYCRTCKKSCEERDAQ